MDTMYFFVSSHTHSHIFVFFFEAFGGSPIMKKSVVFVEMMMENKREITKKVSIYQSIKTTPTQIKFTPFSKYL